MDFFVFRCVAADIGPAAGDTLQRNTTSAMKYLHLQFIEGHRTYSPHQTFQPIGSQPSACASEPYTKVMDALLFYLLLR